MSEPAKADVSCRHEYSCLFTGSDRVKAREREKLRGSRAWHSEVEK